MASMRSVSKNSAATPDETISTTMVAPSHCRRRPIDETIAKTTKTAISTTPTITAPRVPPINAAAVPKIGPSAKRKRQRECGAKNPVSARKPSQSPRSEKKIALELPLARSAPRTKPS